MFEMNRIRHTIQDMSLITHNTAFVIMQMYPRKMANSRFLRVHAKQFTVFCEHSAHTKLKIIIVMFNLHYRKPPVCRVGNTLPCAKTRAHGKPHLCRVPIERAHGNKLAHGKHFLCRVSGQKTHGKVPTHGKGVLLPCAAK